MLIREPSSSANPELQLVACHGISCKHQCTTIPVRLDKCTRSPTQGMYWPSSFRITSETCFGYQLTSYFKPGLSVVIFHNSSRCSVDSASEISVVPLGTPSGEFEYVGDWYTAKVVDLHNGSHRFWWDCEGSDEDCRVAGRLMELGSCANGVMLTSSQSLSKCRKPSTWVFVAAAATAAVVFIACTAWYVAF
jgi:hypothetical protein